MTNNLSYGKVSIMVGFIRGSSVNLKIRHRIYLLTFGKFLYKLEPIQLFQRWFTTQKRSSQVWHK